MDTGPFRWDRRKATMNLRKHGVSFEDAFGMLTGEGPILEVYDDGDDYGEDRWQRVGFDQKGRLLFVVVAEREEHDRIISARLADPNEQKAFSKNTQKKNS